MKQFLTLSLSVILVISLSGCKKTSEGWAGFYYPSGKVTGKEECGIEFETKEECEKWGESKLQGTDEQERYMCGYKWTYDSSCNNAGGFSSEEDYLKHIEGNRCREFAAKNIEDEDTAHIFCETYVETLVNQATSKDDQNEPYTAKKTSETITYHNAKYGFNLELPATWQDYEASESEHESTICFSIPTAESQTFCIFQMYALPKDQAIPHALKLVGQTKDWQITTDEHSDCVQLDETQCARQKEVPEMLTTFRIAENTAAENKGVSSINNLANCDLDERYGLDCAVVKFLEEHLAWTTEAKGVDFCSYESLDQVDNTQYVQAYCQEFYVQAEKIICPDRSSREACFASKDTQRKECKEQCRIEKTSPYLAQGGGVSIPVKLTKEGEGFRLWQPRDGSFHAKDVQENFTPEAYKKFSDRDHDGISLHAINIARAENYFGVPATFNISGSIEKTCEQLEDCGILPGEYAMRSTCPHELKCLEDQCVAGCYDVRDYTDVPQYQAES